VEFSYQGNDSKPITMSSRPLAFWQAVDQVLDQAELDVNFYAGETGELALEPRREGRPSRADSAAYCGVYRLEPTAVTARRNLTQPELSAVNISMELAWEPRLTPIGVTLPITQLTAVLDDGQKLLPQQTAETIDIATSSDIAFSEFFLPMQSPEGRPTKIETLSGVIRALLPGKTQAFEVKLDQPGGRQTIDDMTVTVEQIRPNGPLHEIRVAVSLQDAADSLESHRQWIFENEVHVKRADGTRAEHLGYSVYRQSDDGVGIAYMFELGGAMATSALVYRSPTAVVETTETFVIKDVSLP
ncbi:MAG: hypothetical protein AAGA03_18435, partial [Planctomycetota bacterium]